MPYQITLNKSRTEDDMTFENYLSSFQMIQNVFTEVDEQLEQLRRSRAEFVTLIDSEEEKRYISSVESTYTVLKLNLQTITKNLDSMKTDFENDKNSMHERETGIVETKIAAFYVTLKDRLLESRTVYQAWKEAQKSKIKRQIKNIEIEQKYSDEELDQIVEEDPQVVRKMIFEQVMGKASARLQYAAQDILDKCEDIKKLQRNVRELVEMIREISQIVALQGEKIATISSHVAKAKDSTERAVEKLTKAKEHHSGSRSVS